MNSVRFACRHFVRPVACLAAGLFLVLSALILTGCATTDQESDLPWNEQQPWEGGVAIPGFNNGGDGF